MTELTADLAARFVRLTLGHLGREYPFKMDLVINGPEDLKAPRAHHPIFHGSFDWHSCVHGWWQVMRLARLFPELAEAGAIRARADAMLTPENVAGELAYFERPHGGGASRPYGWAWLLALHGELARHDGPWATVLEPLARALAARLGSYLVRMTYPIRVGTHFNSSFAMVLALRWADRRDPGLADLVAQRARDWFLADRGCQAWEPGGDEFLSSALCEALLMSRVLDRAAFGGWFGDFLPELEQGRPESLFIPATVSDRTDGKIAHLDGLNLSRAWCWREIAAALAPHPLEPVCARLAERHVEASLPHVADDYMGEHWLATYALLALAGD